MKTGYLISSLLVAVQYGHAQGFVNLDFEDANIPPTTAGKLGDFVDPALAFPGWTVLPNSNPGFATSTFYNDLSLGGPAVTLMGPDFPNGPGYESLDGSYSVLLQYFGIGGPPTLSQTGLIPADSQSISVLGGDNDLLITLNGINIPLVSLGNGYAGGNISAFAGTTAQLTISTVDSLPVGSHDWVYFDDIQFSSSPVPEPGEFALGALGALLLGFRRWRPV
jgi:hypothetical protein